MFKVAILGCENSHANGFLSLIKAGKFPEIEVIGVYSDETETAEKLNASYGVAVMKSYDELFDAWDKTIREMTRYSVIVENAIDLASEPGMQGKSVIPARGLPGKYAPESSGKLIADTILRVLKEE